MIINYFVYHFKTKVERHWSVTYSFPWAQEAIGDDLSRSGGNGESDGLVLGSVVGANGTSVDILEDFIESELSESLGRVSNESWHPSL
jgi:hypothetical protein